VLAEIHKRTQGIPRLINLVCENLLLTAFAMASKVATLEMLAEVSNDLRLEWPTVAPTPEPVPDPVPVAAGKTGGKTTARRAGKRSAR
jgi:hypothetical protein